MRAIFCLAFIWTVSAANWALLSVGSQTYDNYRHQADVCHAYQILVSKGFHKEHIVTMLYDDVATDPENPFPGKLFNSPDANGPGDDVYAGCEIDYRGNDVSAENFIGLLLGNGTSGGNGRILNITDADDLFVFHAGHGAPGILHFPDQSVVHASQFQAVLTQMHKQKRYGRMVIYMEACQAGSIFEAMPTDMGIYVVTAIGPTDPSLATYCTPDEAVINGTQLHTCLGDVFSVFWMRYILAGNGTHTLNQFFSSVFEDVASYVALYGHSGTQELNQQYGDLSIANLTVKEFFYPDASMVPASQKQAVEWVRPRNVFEAPHLQQHRIGSIYTEASAQPTYHGLEHWWAMTNATKRFQNLLTDQQETQRLHWNIVMFAHPLSLERQLAAWTHLRKPEAPVCELAVRKALVESCRGKIDMTTSYAFQFHQVIVNLCNDEMLAWHLFPNLGVSAAELACAVSPGMTGAELGMGPQVLGEVMMIV